MNNNGFERFRNVWKKTALAGSTGKVYAEEEIKKFKMKNSKDFSRTLNNVLIFDLGLKSLLIIGMLLLIWFYRSDVALVTVIITLIAVVLFMISREQGIMKKLKDTDNYSKQLTSIIADKIAFYKSYFPSLQWMMAFTNGLLVWVGSMYYFYSKYGYYRIDDVTDVAVNALMVLFAIAISYFSYQSQYKFNLNELEENLVDLDSDKAATVQLQNQRARKARYRMSLIIFSIVGLLLFIYLLISYLSRAM